MSGISRRRFNQMLGVGGLSALMAPPIREPREPADLTNPWLRTLAPTSVNFVVVPDAGNPEYLK